jgi:hypothetical protein
VGEFKGSQVGFRIVPGRNFPGPFEQQNYQEAEDINLN